MKKTIKLNEDELVELIKKSLNEQNQSVKKFTQDFRVIPENTMYHQVAIRRKGNFLNFYIGELDTMFRIKVQ